MDWLREWWLFHGEQARRWGLPVVGLLLACGLAFGLTRAGFPGIPKCGHLFLPACQACPEVAPAVTARSAGRYDEVAKLVSSALQAKPDQQCWQDFESQFNADLSVKFKLEYLPGHRGAAQPASGGQLRLSANDPYWVDINASSRAFIYLFQVDAAGRLSAIFPNEKTSGLKNPVSPGVQRIPGENKFLSVSAQPGTERLYLIAANWDIPEFDQLAKDALTAKDDRRKELATRFLARAANEKEYAAPLAGLAFGQWSIESLGAVHSESAKKE